MIKTAFHANHNVNERGHHYMYLTDEQTQEAISRIKSFLASAPKDQLLTLARGDIDSFDAPYVPTIAEASRDAMRALTPEGLAAPLLPSSLIPERPPTPTLKAQLNQLAQQQASEDAVQKAIALMNLQLIARDMAVTLLRRRYENQQVLLASQSPVTVHNPLGTCSPHLNTLYNQ